VKRLRQWAKKLRGESLETVLFLPDTHCPYHDRRAFDLVESVVEKILPKRCVIGGDFADFYQVSTHSKQPGVRMAFDDEVAETKKLLRRVESWGFKQLDYIEGNHENRLDRYIADTAKEMDGIVNTDQLLRLSDHGWTITKYKNHTQVGKAYVTHDLGKAGDNAVKDAVASYQDNVVINHTHRMQYRVEGNAKGIPHVGASFGWLGDVTKVDYMHRIRANRDWALGFGVGYLRENGLIYLQPVPIVAYSCVVEGELFEV
jgi:hypothetical protein